MDKGAGVPNTPQSASAVPSRSPYNPGRLPKIQPLRHSTSQPFLTVGSTYDAAVQLIHKPSSKTLAYLKPTGRILSTRLYIYTKKGLVVPSPFLLRHVYQLFSR